MQTTKIQQDGTYNFEFVKAGEYKVSVVNERYCFKETTLSVSLGDKYSVQNADFAMLGHKVQYESTHSFTGVASQDSRQFEIEILKGEGHFC